MILAACFVASGWLLVSAVRDMRDADAAVCMVLLVAVAVMMEIAWVVTGRRMARITLTGAVHVTPELIRRVERGCGEILL